jgi:hypothetical protein
MFPSLASRRELAAFLTLALLMPWIAAHDEDNSSAAHNLAVVAKAFNAGANLHGNFPPSMIPVGPKAHQYNGAFQLCSSPELRDWHSF